MILAMLIGALLFAPQDDQRPREPKKDDRGLLQINRQFYHLAAATGGDVYMWATGEFGASRLNMPLSGDAVLLSYGTLASKTPFRIPVESNVSQLTVFASMQRKDLAVLVRPDGTVMHDGIQQYQHMLIATVPAPAAGVWTLELEGAGLYAVTAHAQSDSPFGFDFEKCAASVSESLKQVELTFVSADGSLIEKIPASGADCNSPHVPYRVMMRAVDPTGAALQRLTNQTHTARTVR